MLEAVFGGIGAAKALAEVSSGPLDRYLKMRAAKLDAKALRRMLLLEVRYNLAILDVAVGRKAPLAEDALWNVPSLLQTEMLEAVLGSSKEAEVLTKQMKGIKIEDKDLISETSGVIANIYARIVALQGLGVLNRRVGLQSVKIELRLKNLHTSLKALRESLAAQNKERSKK